MNEKITRALPTPGLLLGLNGTGPELTSVTADCCGKTVTIRDHQVDLMKTREMPVICLDCANDLDIVLYRGGIMGVRGAPHPVTGEDHGRPPIHLAALGATDD